MLESNSAIRIAGEGQKNFLMPDSSKQRMKLAPGVAGACREVTCPVGWNTYRDAEHTVDSMTLYDAWRKSGCMKGAFFGHDHTLDRNRGHSFRRAVAKISSALYTRAQKMWYNSFCYHDV